MVSGVSEVGPLDAVPPIFELVLSRLDLVVNHLGQVKEGSLNTVATFGRRLKVRYSVLGSEVLFS